jgi:hypothetical protein
MSAFCQLAPQHDVAIQNGARRIGHRVLLVIAFGQHGVDGRHAALPLLAVAGALHQLRQHAEDRRRIAARGRRLAQGQRNSRRAMA